MSNPLLPNNSASNTTAPPLSPQQAAAAEALLAGQSITDAARRAGVHRATVHAWIRNHPHIGAAIVQGRARIAAALHDDLSCLAQLASARLRDILESELAPREVQLRAAVAVLKTVHPLLQQAQPPGGAPGTTGSGSTGQPPRLE